MSYIFSFEKLNVWIDSKNLVKTIYSITNSFPDQEKFGLVRQLRRASISVASNLPEGTSRNSKKDKAYFSTMACTSLMEVLNQIIIAFELNFIEENMYSDIRSEIEKIANKLNALKKSQLRD